MKELVKELFFLFSMETGILGVVKENETFLGYILIALAIVLCFFGFKIYRGVFSVLMFIGSTLIIVFLMRGRSDWGTITTTFAVLGTVIAFFSYRMNLLGGYTISILSGLSIGWIYTHSIWVSILIATLVGVFMKILPVITLCFMTSLWGVIVIQGFPIIGDRGIWIPFIILILGFSLQIIMSKNQTLFDNPFPNEMKKWIEKKKETSS